MAPSFLLLHVITNEKSLKFTQIGRLLSASRASPQKHVPTTLVGIPVDIYTLVDPALLCPPRGRRFLHRKSPCLCSTVPTKRPQTSTRKSTPPSQGLPLWHSPLDASKCLLVWTSPPSQGLPPWQLSFRDAVVLLV